MKNRFIQMFLVICAVMLMICTVSVWAAAEDVTATPTDLAPVEQEESVPETTEPETTEPETTEPEATESQAAESEVVDPEEAVEEEAADSMEIIITKAVRIGDSWSGTMKKTKPAVLKLDIDHAQQVNLVVLGRHGWITVEKSDRLSDNPARTLTDDGTSQTVISWYAEAGSYLITLGPVEPNLMAKLNVSIMNDAAYSEWIAQQQAEEITEEEPAEETEEIKEPAEEPEEERAEETDETEIPVEEIEEETDEPDEIEEERETTEEPVDEEAPGEETDEENTEETAEEPEEITEEEPAEESEDGQEDIEETGEETEESIPESEMAPERHIRVDVTWDVPDPIIGDTAHFVAVMEGYDELQYTVQWQYSPDEETWYDIPNETNTTMDVVVTPENNIVYWRILVYVEENQED